MIPLALTAAASTDAGKHKSILGSDNNTAILTISNEVMEDIIKIVKSLEDSTLLLKGVSEAIQDVAKEQKRNRVGDGIIRSGYGSKKGF